MISNASENLDIWMLQALLNSLPLISSFCVHLSSNLDPFLEIKHFGEVECIINKVLKKLPTDRVSEEETPQVRLLGRLAPGSHI